MDNTTGWFLDEYDGPRFWKFVNRDGGTAHEADPLATAVGECWTWTGASSHGYGSFRLAGRMQAAHRIGYVDGGRKNRIPEGHVLDHLCRNKLCVRASHLDPVEMRANVDRGLSSRWALTHCPNGHEYTPENTKMLSRGPDKSRIRACATCVSDWRRRGNAKYNAKKVAT